MERTTTTNLEKLNRTHPIGFHKRYWHTTVLKWSFSRILHHLSMEKPNRKQKSKTDFRNFIFQYENIHNFDRQHKKQTNFRGEANRTKILLNNFSLSISCPRNYYYHTISLSISGWSFSGSIWDLSTFWLSGGLNATAN